MKCRLLCREIDDVDLNMFNLVARHLYFMRLGREVQPVHSKKTSLFIENGERGFLALNRLYALGCARALAAAAVVCLCDHLLLEWRFSPTCITQADPSDDTITSE